MAAAQGAATRDQPVDHWWDAGGKDVLVVQPADDVMAVVENAERLVATDPDRVHMVVVADAGHALLPEQPAAVADAVLEWLRRRDLGSRGAA